MFNLEKDHRTLKHENKCLQLKHEKVCSDANALKADKEVLEKGTRSFSVALVTAQKDLEDNVGNFNKKLAKYKVDVKKLQEYKDTKTSQEKQLAFLKRRNYLRM